MDNDLFANELEQKIFFNGLAKRQLNNKEVELKVLKDELEVFNNNINKHSSTDIPFSIESILEAVSQKNQELANQIEDYKTTCIDTERKIIEDIEANIKFFLNREIRIEAVQKIIEMIKSNYPESKETDLSELLSQEPFDTIFKMEDPTKSLEQENNVSNDFSYSEHLLPLGQKVVEIKQASPELLMKINPESNFKTNSEMDDISYKVAGADYTAMPSAPNTLVDDYEEKASDKIEDTNNLNHEKEEIKTEENDEDFLSWIGEQNPETETIKEEVPLKSIETDSITPNEVSPFVNEAENHVQSNDVVEFSASEENLYQKSATDGMSLKAIAEKYLGDEERWPEIYQDNEAMIVARINEKLQSQEISDVNQFEDNPNLFEGIDITIPQIEEKSNEVKRLAA